MKNKKKKGFTIVELVIVIAVIAILAAVLIPTFSSVIKKANQAADIQAARQMDVALQAESVIETPTDFKAVVAILGDAGFDVEDPLMPITQDHTFYWHKTHNAIVLANEEEGAAPVVLYPTENEALVSSFATDKALTGDAKVLYDLAECVQYVVVKIGENEVDKLVNALDKGQKVELTEDITLDASSIPEGDYMPDLDYADPGLINIAPDSNVTIDLNGKTLTVNGVDKSYIRNEGNFTLEGNGGTLIINGSGENAVAAALDNAASGTMTVKDVTIKSNVSNIYAVTNTSYGQLNLVNTTINATGACLNVQRGTVTATDCTFISKEGDIQLTAAGENVAGSSIKKHAENVTHAIRVDYGSGASPVLTLNGTITVDITNPITEGSEYDYVASVVVRYGFGKKADGSYGYKNGVISATNEYTFKTNTAGKFSSTDVNANYVYTEYYVD